MRQTGSGSHSKNMTASFSPQKYKLERTVEHSTADKLEDFEHTHRLMETVLEENRLLKSKLQAMGAETYGTVEGLTALVVSGHHGIEEWELRERN